jgi:phosphate:Na+ symporter
MGVGIGSVLIVAQASASVDWVTVLVGLFGGVALLLFGLDQLTSALRGVAGDQLRTLLARLTNNRIAAALTGVVTTAIVQSSTVTTVLVVGFVGAGVMSLMAALGVILGSNVGTTVTAQVVAFDVAEWALGLVAVGFLASTLARGRHVVAGWGTAVLALGLVFLGMQAMTGAVSPLRTHAPFLDLIARLGTPWVGVVVGAAFTALIHSSAATTVLVIALASQGLLSLEAGVALVIGANIGTCVTAALAAIGRSRDAQRAAAGHVLFNLAGAAVWLVLFGPLLAIARAISPERQDLDGLARLAAEVPRQLANAHTVFNVANVLLFIGLLGPVAVLLRKVIPDRVDAPVPPSQPRYLDRELLTTPALALAAAGREVGRLGGLTLSMLDQAPQAVLSGPRVALDRLVEDDTEVDLLYDHVIGYLAALSKGTLSGPEGRRLLTLLEAANALESIADVVETNLVAIGHRRLDAGVRVAELTSALLTELFAAVNGTVTDAIAAVVDEDADAADRVFEGKTTINRRLDEAKRYQLRRLVAPEEHRSLLYALETDIIETIKRIEYHARHMVRPRLAADSADADDGPSP